MLRLCSPSAQVKAAAAHVRSLKQNQQKKKLILSLWALRIIHQFVPINAATIKARYPLRRIEPILKFLSKAHIELLLLSAMRSTLIHSQGPVFVKLTLLSDS
jgi:hypothetical protein